MNQNLKQAESHPADEQRYWFCIRSHPKSEHIAARNLKQVPGLEVFNPQLRLRKLTARGPVWFTESLFPNYLFARFPLSAVLENVKFTSCVSHVVHFGDRYPAIPDEVIAELRKHFEGEELQLSAVSPSKGDKVTLTDPQFHGLQATVLRVMPSKQRVQVLLEILGQISFMELDLHLVMPERKPLPSGLVSMSARAR